MSSHILTATLAGIALAHRPGRMTRLEAPIDARPETILFDPAEGAD